MLPWIFGVLVLLNLAVFLWGYQRETPAEPHLTPVPAGLYEIRLRVEAEEDAAGALSESAALVPGPIEPPGPPAAQDSPVSIEAAAVDPENPPEADAIVLETEPPEPDGAGADQEPAAREEGAFGPVSQGPTGNGSGEPATPESKAESAAAASPDP